MPAPYTGNVAANCCGLCDSNRRANVAAGYLPDGSALAAPAPTETETETETETCDRCSEDCDDTETVGDEQWCAFCVSDHSFMCAECQERQPVDGSVTYRRSDARNNVRVCSTCLESSETCNCPQCGDSVIGDTHTVRYDGRDQTWCERCTDRDASWSDRLEQYTADGDDSDEVPDYGSNRRRGYSPIPSPWCDKQTARMVGRVRHPLRFGFELEVEVPSQTAPFEVGQRAKDQLGPLCAGFESDGSLRHGVEIISQPAGLDVHREHVAKLALQRGVRSHDTETCGLHVHFTRDAVSRLTVCKVVRLFGRDEDQAAWSRFFRRDLNRYAASCKKPNVRAMQSGDRYETINVTNERTIEVRWGRGTTVPGTILATLEMVHAAIRYCEVTGWRDLSFAGLCRYIAHDPWIRSETEHLRAYLCEKELGGFSHVRTYETHEVQGRPVAVEVRSGRHDRDDPIAAIGRITDPAILLDLWETQPESRSAIARNPAMPEEVVPFEMLTLRPEISDDGLRRVTERTGSCDRALGPDYRTTPEQRERYAATMVGVDPYGLRQALDNGRFDPGPAFVEACVVSDVGYLILPRIGRFLTAEQCERLFRADTECPGRRRNTLISCPECPGRILTALLPDADTYQSASIRSHRNYTEETNVCA